MPLQLCANGSCNIPSAFLVQADQWCLAFFLVLQLGLTFTFPKRSLVNNQVSLLSKPYVSLSFNYILLTNALDFFYVLLTFPTLFMIVA